MNNLPPFSQEAEQGLLGSILIDNSLMNFVCEQVESEYFYFQLHQRIYSVMKSLHSANKPIDLVTMSDQLDKLEEENAIVTVSELIRNTPSSASYKTYCEIIKNRWIGRQLIAAGNNLTERVYSGEDYDQAREQAFKDLEKLFADNGHELIADGQELATSFIDELERINQVGGMSGLSTGDKHIDEATGGFQPGDYITIAARSGGGKTTKALNIMRHFVENDRRCLMFSMEMKRQRVMMKIVSDMANVYFSKIKNADLNDYEWSKVGQAIKKIKESKLHVDDSSGLRMQDIERKARQLKAKYGELHLIVVDYVQRINVDSKNMYSELTEASRRLKDLFMELNCSGIVLAQLKKNSMGLPNGSDLRETGGIENDSDLVIFLHTDSEDRKPKKGMLTCEIFNKVRYGETGIKMLSNELEYQRFSCVDDEYSEPDDKKSFRV